ncbi:MAG: glycoside hydrolase family 57 protein [Phycisphaeraceae bacterium]|nr:glycoside hydrolase family 57 protein [Phycisphaeraceae bacterium]
MASVCFYFQVHQPCRLRRYSVFDAHDQYFDDHRNLRILQRVVKRCYLPTTQLLGRLIEKHKGKFRVAFSLTGSIIEQLQQHAPEVIAEFQKLAATGCVEFLAETYHHSLALLYSPAEFDAQVDLHAGMIREFFGQTPKVFRNTELIYSNDLANHLAAKGKYLGVLTEGVDQLLGKRSPNLIYQSPAPPSEAGGASPLKLLLKNYRLSDDIAFRFSNRSWSGFPLTAEKFAGWLRQSALDPCLDANGKNPRTAQVLNLFMDFETFGEHQWPETGILAFLEELPHQVLDLAGLDFKTPSQCLTDFPAGDTYDAPHMISWADTERDLSAWLGNAMQSNALHELYQLEGPVKQCGDQTLLADWRRLTTSDHFYYMCTKYFADGAVHKYFNPYESPYDSYINFMNVLDHLRWRIAERDQTVAAQQRL